MNNTNQKQFSDLLSNYIKLEKELYHLENKKRDAKRAKDFQAEQNILTDIKEHEKKINVMIQLNDDYIKKWITDGLDGDAIEYVELAGQYAKDKGLTTSQIRQFFGEVRRIQMKSFQYETSQRDDDKSIPPFPETQALRMLIPKIAYSAKRADKVGTDYLKNILTVGLKTVLEDETKIPVRLENFANLFEAILAYHKVAGGK